MSLSASVAVRAAPTFWPAAVFSATLRAAVSAENAGGLLGTTTAAATWKTAESPYMGRVLAVPVTALLLRGPWRALEELGRPTFVPPAAPNPCEMEPSSASVPLCSQPVKGRLTDWEVSGPLVPDSFLSLTSSSQDPS